MKTKVQSFSFLMELIIVIFFFALASTVCVSFIAKAHEKQDLGENIELHLLQAETIIETLQAHPQRTPDQLFVMTKQDSQTYIQDEIVVRYRDEKLTHGVVEIYNGEKLIESFPFVLGGDVHE